MLCYKIGDGMFFQVVKQSPIFGTPIIFFSVSRVRPSMTFNHYQVSSSLINYPKWN